MQEEIQLDREKICCSICLDLLKDPVTIPCGHSYCMSCIGTYWDAEGQKETRSCPQCRQTFTQRPDLAKNTLLADLVENLKRTGLQAAPDGPCYARHEDVACDVCTGRKRKATKSCLQCLVSYCDQHLQPHYESAAFGKHQLVEPCQKLQENICTSHNEVMKIFCRTDQQCICYLCSMDEHKGHNTVSAAAEVTMRQREFSASQQTIQQKIQKREEDLKMLQQEVESINQSADAVESSSEKIFAGLIHLVQKRRADVSRDIRTKQTHQLNRLKELQKKLEEELDEMKRRDTELEQLSHTQNYILFLKNYSLLLSPIDSADPNSINIHPGSYFEDALAAVSAVADKLQDVLTEEWINISDPKNRSEFLQYSQEMTLDPNTAHNQLLLSEGNRKAMVMRKAQPYPHHPGRFINRQQVLGTQSLTGRHYWEVQIDPDVVRATLAVTYNDVSRKDKESCFGCNDRSWALVFSGNDYNIMHNNSSVFIPSRQCCRIGVYLDKSAGTVSFYSVSDTMSLLHRVQATFTRPLYAGFGVSGYDKSVELCALK